LTPPSTTAHLRAGDADPGPTSSFLSLMDRDFIAKNQIVERYFADKLPPRGALDFERYCRDNPEILDELRVALRVQAGLRLMVAGGIPLPWEERPKQWWEQLPVIIGAGALTLILAIASASLALKLSGARHQVDALKSEVQERPIQPIRSTHTVLIVPGRSAPSAEAALTVSNGSAEFVDLKFKMEWSAYSQFRVTIDRVGQGRVMVLGNVLRDSNGQLRIAVNSAALGPGKYQFAIEGLTLGNEARPQAWFTLGIS
jgi:hypothetical protein